MTEECKRYRIIRCYFHDIPTCTIKQGLSLREAQAHCNDPQTSSSTCTDKVGKARTRKIGPWFDAYEEVR